MKYISVAVLLFTTLLLNTYNAKEENSLEPTSTLFNFTNPEITTVFENWTENYQSALLLYLLNPRENGSSFAGVYRILDTPDISKYTGVLIDLHRQGLNSKFQFVLFGECLDIRNCESHESQFETSGERERVKIPFSTFKPYFRGTPKSNITLPNLSHTSRIGIKVYGGSNTTTNHFGPGSIEIFTISAYTDDQTPA
ncbi:unnamed protein product [Schistosoma margrebowiei]|uniref:Uncharacterized protein n=1 Tax=Schistosoma margrebowiei TaxID=48269 RepID=A0A183LI01_9TREM|nr:unnamed protein product [Schistosoma margrebowiei]